MPVRHLKMIKILPEAAPSLFSLRRSHDVLPASRGDGAAPSLFLFLVIC